MAYKACLVYLISAVIQPISSYINIYKLKFSSAIHILYILPALILIANSSVAQSSEENLHSDQDISSIVAEFVRLLDKVKTTTIEDYQKFFGYSDVKELHFHWRNCEKNDFYHLNLEIHYSSEVYL